MTVYFIYKHGNGFTPFLYAYTNKEYLKDTFLEERKKDMFIAKEKQFKKELYKSFVDKHRGLELGTRGFETSPHPYDLISKRTHIYLTATADEEMDVITKADDALNELGKHTFEYARCFNHEIIQALHALHYFEIYKFWALPFDGFDDFVAGIENNINDLNGHYIIDSFGVFMYLYGYTLDTKGILKK